MAYRSDRNDCFVTRVSLTPCGELSAGRRSLRVTIRWRASSELTMARRSLRRCPQRVIRDWASPSCPPI